MKDKKMELIVKLILTIGENQQKIVEVIRQLGRIVTRNQKELGELIAGTKEKINIEILTEHKDKKELKGGINKDE